MAEKDNNTPQEASAEQIQQAMAQAVKAQQAAAQAEAKKQRAKASWSHNLDADFASDRSAAVLMHQPKTLQTLLRVMLAIVVCLVIWSLIAKTDEIVRAQGKAVPSSHTQVVQSLDGGVIKTINIREGQAVKKGDVLMVLDASQASSNLSESESNYYALLGENIRLEAELAGKKPVFEDSFNRKYPEFANNELRVYRIRQANLQHNLNDIDLKRRKSEQTLVSRQQQARDFNNQLRLLQRQLDLNKPLYVSGAVSEQEILSIEQQISRTRTEANQNSNQIPELNTEIERLEKQHELALSEHQEKTQDKLTEVKTKLNAAAELRNRKQSSLDRTQLIAPVDGVVQKLYNNTIGGVIRPGVQVVDIIPMNDEILLEAKVKPKDIGFVHPGLHARVKVTAYEFAVYGGLDGIVESVSADTIVDKKGMSYYIVKIRVPKNNLGDEDNPLPVIPGMVASIDIKVAKKTIFSYLMKPLFKLAKA